MKKKYIILIAILVLLIAARIALPYIVKNYLNNLLENLDGYTGRVEDVDLHLYRGAYRIDQLAIYTTEQDLGGRPFFSSNQIDLAISWRDIFKGAIVGKVILGEPQLNFVAVESEEDSMATGEEVDWTDTIKDLIPLDINLFQIKGGKINYIDEFSAPPVDIYLHQMNFTLENIKNTDDDSDPLPSPFSLTAVSLGNGVLHASGKANLLRQVPNFDLDLKFQSADLTAFNDFFEAYAWFDFEKGNFDLFTEIALIDSSLEGYFKPLLNDIQVLDWEEEEGGFLNKIYQGIVGGAGQVFKNRPEDQSATRVEISGTLQNTDVGVFTAIMELLKNAFIQPLKKDLEERIAVRGKAIIVQKE